MTRDDLSGKPVPAEQNAATYLVKLEAMDRASPVTSDEVEALDHLSVGSFVGFHLPFPDR